MMIRLADGQTIEAASIAKGRTRYDSSVRDALILDIPLESNDLSTVYAMLSEENCETITRLEDGKEIEIYPDYCIRAAFEVVSERDDYTGEDVSFIRATMARMTYLEKKLR